MDDAVLHCHRVRSRRASATLSDWLTIANREPTQVIIPIELKLDTFVVQSNGISVKLNCDPWLTRAGYSALHA